MLYKVLVSPNATFDQVAAAPPSFRTVALRYASWLGLIPPASAFLGTTTFGWRFGVGEPLILSWSLALTICVAYYAFLLAGFVVTLGMMRWMSPVYGAVRDPGAHATVLVTAAMPLMLGGVAHVYPLVELNLMMLVPAMLWAMFLLYAGLPKVLGTGPDRGMLMATSILGVLFVGVNAMMGFTVMLWTLGIGPDIGFNWRFSISG